jgi:sugar-phosphatase
MDGTLVDSTASVERQWRRWAARHGIDPEPILKISHGRRTIETLREVAPHLASDEEAASFDVEEAQDREDVVAITGAIDFVSALPAAKWAVVTSANRQLAVERLQIVGLPVPSVLVSAEDVHHGKPHPEGFLLAARLLGVAPERCLVIEDTPPGLQSGRAAGMQVLGMATTYTPSVLEGAPCIADFTAVRVTAENDLQILVRTIETRG